MPEKSQIVLKGKPISPGIAIGKVLALERKIELAGQLSIESSLVEQELKKFEQALADTKKELLEISRTVAQELDSRHMQIFEAQIVLLDDPEVKKDVEKEIRENLKSASAAYREVLEKSMAGLARSENQYLKERVSEVQAVKNRVLEHLRGEKLGPGVQLSSPAIILANFLSPGELIQLDKNNILALAVKEAGVTSHVALLARAFSIPAVVALEDEVDLKGFTLKVHPEGMDVLAIVDGSSGQVILFPEEKTLLTYQNKRRSWKKSLAKLQKSSRLPCQTKDKTKITLLANIDIPEEADSALKYGAQGVGLFRTEFMFLGASGFPSEEEQYKVYSEILQKFRPHPVTIRTTDLGGDKFLAADQTKDPNPYLGWRAVRVCLDSPALFKTQLRALYRASLKGNLKIMIPMISCQEEVDQVLRIASEVRQGLKKEKVKFNPHVPLGIMVEIPAAALNASGLAKKVDFFSLGTNDLTQYTLAVDRGNKKVARLFDELDPAVLRLIQMTVQAARKDGIGVSICGELAASGAALPVLLGLGLREISVAPLHLPRIKEMTSKINLGKARKLAQRICRLTDRSRVRGLLKQYTI